MTRGLGSVFQHFDVWLQVVMNTPSASCNKCYFHGTGYCIRKNLDITGECVDYKRADGTNVHFERVPRIGSEQKLVEELMSKIKPQTTMKPFNLEAAKEGKPVCTRDGRKARIICFDRESSYHPIIALVTDSDGQEKIWQYLNTGKLKSWDDNHLDLMMASEKKKGWVNVYKGGLLDTKSYNTKKEAFDKASPRDYIATVKIEWEE